MFVTLLIVERCQMKHHLQGRGTYITNEQVYHVQECFNLYDL